MDPLGMPASISVRRDEALTHIVFTREHKLNAFDETLVDQLLDAVNTASNDGTRLLVLSGAGKGFSGGFDLDGLDTASDGDMLLRFVRVEQVLQAIYHAPMGTLALVHGACFGAAADLAAACHQRVAAPGARFRMPGPKFDVILGTARLTHQVGADHARQLLLRDGPFSAEQALEAGFIGEIAARESWDEHIAQALARALQVSAQTYRALSERIASDTRDADLAALVRSVSNGSIKARIATYVEAMKQARKS
jgi:enoyl-CoA hydratase/carnithine racemase